MTRSSLIRITQSDTTTMEQDTHDYDRDSYIGAFNVIRSKEVTNSGNQSVTELQICRTYEKYHNPTF